MSGKFWKTLSNINNKISSSTHIHLGRKFHVPVLNAKSKIKCSQESSLKFHGAKLFNYLRKTIINSTNVKIEVFMSSLGGDLMGIPFEPHVIGSTACRI